MHNVIMFSFQTWTTCYVPLSVIYLASQGLLAMSSMSHCFDILLLLLLFRKIVYIRCISVSYFLEICHIGVLAYSYRVSVKHRTIHLPTTSSATAIQMLLEVGGWGGGVHILHEASEEEAKPTKAANTHQKPKKNKAVFSSRSNAFKPMASPPSVLGRRWAGLLPKRTHNQYIPTTHVGYRTGCYVAGWSSSRAAANGVKVLHWPSHRHACFLTTAIIPSAATSLTIATCTCHHGSWHHCYLLECTMVLV